MIRHCLFFSIFIYFFPSVAAKASACKAVVLNEGLFYAPPRHLAMSGDIWLSQSLVVVGCHWHLVERGQGATEQPTVLTTQLHTVKNCLGQNVNSAKVEKS